MTNSNPKTPVETFRYTKTFRGRELPFLLRLAHLIRAVVFSPILLVEWKALMGRRKSQTKLAVTLINDISNATHGRGLEVMNTLICRLRNVMAIGVEQRAHSFLTAANHPVDLQKIDLVINELRQTGFSRVKMFLDPCIAATLNTAVSGMSGVSSHPSSSYMTQVEWQRDVESGPRFTINAEEVEKTKEFESIAMNEMIREVARQYLGCAPILASIKVWTTRPPTTTSSEVLSEAAMAFHCDADYFGFLKFFILLSDVSVDNGPFALIGGSHRGPRHVAGRMRDSEVVAADDVVYYGTGQAGDLIIADTKGWHKASPPISGFRTMLQLVFSSSLFGFPTQ